MASAFFMAGVSLDSVKADSLLSLTGESELELVDVAAVSLVLTGLGVDCCGMVRFWLLMGLIIKSP